MICTSYLFIDASTDQGYEEEGGYYEEEAEENFNHCSAQGKTILASYSLSKLILIMMQALLIKLTYAS